MTSTEPASRRRIQLGMNLGAFCAPALVGLVLVWAMGPRTPTVIAVSITEFAVLALLATQIVLYADVAARSR
ncbi:hypothetical protein ACIBI7_53315 [Nonomuraea fuscirosea]|uniref:hypothetical protein n=1 Tax=Nonomuraea fuscirosea TaxID=1291556 RepID=UPI0037AA2E4A